MSAVTVRGVHKRFGDVEVLRGVDLDVHAGETLAIVGASGSGKSTLLHVLGALDSADAGEIEYDGRSIPNMGGNERSALRNTQFGFVFQFYHLLPELNVLENTLLAPMIQYSWLGYRARRRELLDRATHVLTQLGMNHRLKQPPNRLSGGERQRVAIARSLANGPSVLLADEPTGNLDSENAHSVLDLIIRLQQEQGRTLLLVTHDPSIAARASRTLHMKDGRIVSDQSAPRDAAKI